MKKNILMVGLVVVVGLNTVLNMAAKDESPVAAPSKAEIKEETPLTISGYEPFVFRKIEETELRLHVIKPKGWKASDNLPCFVFFFGGGWAHGSPKGSLLWTKWAANHGMVGIAPDYRTLSRHGSTVEDSVSDGRAAVRWVQAHAAELGVDPAKIICSGASAGGHLAAWTAIPGKGPGADDPGGPNPQPAALVLLCPASDTTASGSAGAQKRFNGSAARALACSVTDQIPAKMPPTIIFHGTADAAVPYANSKALQDKLAASGNRSELVTFEGGKHMYWTAGAGKEWASDKQKTENDITKFLSSLKLIHESSGKPKSNLP